MLILLGNDVFRIENVETYEHFRYLYVMHLSFFCVNVLHYYITVKIPLIIAKHRNTFILVNHLKLINYLVATLSEHDKYNYIKISCLKLLVQKIQLYKIWSEIYLKSVSAFLLDFK